MGKKGKVIALVIAGLLALGAGLFFIFRPASGIEIGGNVTYKVVGITGCGNIEFGIIQGNITDDIVKNNDKIDEANARKIVESIVIEADTDRNGKLANGDKVYAKLSYDEELAKTHNIKLVLAENEFEISNLKDGKELNIFDNVDVVVAGVSPETFVVVKNNWKDEYLKDVTFDVDKKSGIVTGDKIVVTCNATQSEAASYGYAFTNSKKEFVVDKVDTYTEGVNDLDIPTLKNVWNKIKECIQTQTEDTSFRMLYKAFQDSAILKEYNSEKIEDLKLRGAYYLKAMGENADLKNNYIYYLIEARITNGERTENVYFGFEFYDASLDVDRKFNLAYDKLEERYVVSRSYDVVYENLINAKLDKFNVARIEGVE